MKFRSDNKDTNQYMLHAVAIESVEKTDSYEIVEFVRGHEQGIALIVDTKVVEIYVDDKVDWNLIKEMSKHKYIAKIKATWMYFYNN